MPRLLCAALFCVVASACERSTPAEPGTSTARAPARSAAELEADRVFADRCATCHGSSGAGNGPASAALTPRPRDLRMPAWQGSVTDEHIEKIIVVGGAGVGRSPVMPAAPDLAKKPEVVAALRAKVRALAAAR